MTEHDPDAPLTQPGVPTYSRTEGDGGTTTEAAEQAPEPEGPEFKEGALGDQGEYVPEALEATGDTTTEENDTA